MSMNTPYLGPEQVPSLIPIFPLSGALLLPRGQLPLNIFEPRYLTMVDDALATHRVIGLIQPESDAETATPALHSVGCAGRLTQFAETGDGRYLISLTGIARFRLVEEIATPAPYRQARIDFSAFRSDFTPREGEEAVDRASVLATLRQFADANELEVDWDSIREAPNEALVNALSMMSPYGPREKQALLEAPDLQRRAEVLIAITELELSKRTTTPLQ
ncbi:MAG TPA: LON peptidase substrate-binding domain-containing protein [Methylovirgula sp.]|nr:LON peptidase substrate-binding domain-containing protein [Methylovirgula sp.]